MRGVNGAVGVNEVETIKRDVINAITTNETFFFRELAQYDALRHTVLPALMPKRKDTRKLRFWSASPAPVRKPTAWPWSCWTSESMAGTFKLPVQT